MFDVLEMELQVGESYQIWVLGYEHGTSVRTIHTLNC